MTFGAVLSDDGTSIGFEKSGSGPSVVLVHGAMQDASSLSRLAEALSATFTVYVPDRRGRGSSGPFGPGHGIDRAREDVLAMVGESGATRVFGLSAGAIAVLAAAIKLPAEFRIALYEPPIPLPDETPTPWLPAYRAAMERGDTAAAFVAVITGTGREGAMRFVPRRLLVALFRKAFAAGDPEALKMRDLVATMNDEVAVVHQSTPLLEQATSAQARFLLMGGKRSNRRLYRSLDVLERTLPNQSRVELRGTGHTAPDNGGRPNLVADALRKFWSAGKDPSSASGSSW